MNRLLKLLLGLSSLLLLAGGASAQDDIEQRLIELLNERDRQDMHPGNPLKLVGVEQEGNSFRERTPALLNSDRVAALVDPEENRARRLAMYEAPVRMDRALPVQSLLGSSASPRYQAPAKEEPEPEQPAAQEDDGNDWALRVASAVGALCCLLAVKSRLG